MISAWHLAFMLIDIKFTYKILINKIAFLTFRRYCLACLFTIFDSLFYKFAVFTNNSFKSMNRSSICFEGSLIREIVSTLSPIRSLHIYIYSSSVHNFVVFMSKSMHVCARACARILLVLSPFLRRRHDGVIHSIKSKTNLYHRIKQCLLLPVWYPDLCKIRS